MLVSGSFGGGTSTIGGGAGSSALEEVRAYWEALRENGRLPKRRDIDPRGLAGTLEQVFLIERIGFGHARFRLTGNLFHDIMGMDVRGMPLSTLFEPMARARLKPVLEDIFESATALHLGLEAERGIGRPALEGKMLILPLRTDSGEPQIALGVLDTQGVLGRTPRRFTLRSEAVFASELVSRITHRGEIEPPGSAEGPTRANGIGERPALRLVHSRED
jgi:hypothetical protein